MTKFSEDSVYPLSVLFYFHIKVQTELEKCFLRKIIVVVLFLKTGLDSHILTTKHLHLSK